MHRPSMMNGRWPSLSACCSEMETTPSGSGVFGGQRAVVVYSVATKTSRPTRCTSCTYPIRSFGPGRFGCSEAGKRHQMNCPGR